MRFKPLLFILLFIPATLMFASNNSSRINTVNYNTRSEPKTIDPQLATDESAINVLHGYIEGLTKLGEDGLPIPAYGQSWTISKDGLVWTFNLRKDGQWANGEPITAEDFYLGFKRALNPATGAEYAYILYYIKNAEAYNTGEIKDFSQVGVKILSPYKIQFTLNAPVPFFDQLLAMPIAAPVSQSYLAKYGTNYCLDAYSTPSNGPWELTQWVHGGRFTLTKNPTYYDKKDVKVDTINAYIIPDGSPTLAWLMTGDLDFGMLTADTQGKYKNSPGYRSAPDLSSWYLMANVNGKYLKNINIRRAIALSINRDELCKNIRQDGSVPALSFVPYGISNGTPGGDYRTEFGNNMFKDNDPTEARALFIKGLKELGLNDNPSTVTLELLTDSTPGGIRDSQYIQQQLQKGLGIKVKISATTFQIRLSKMDSGSFDLCMAGWSPDYNDPMTFMEMWVTGGGNNYMKYSSPAYDALIKKAKSTNNETIRMQAMYDAEKVLMNDMSVIPLYFGTRTFMINSRLKGVVINSGNPLFQWTTIKSAKGGMN